MTARKRLLTHGGHELVTFEQGTLAPSSVCPRRSLWQDERVNDGCELDPCRRAHSANRDLYLKRHGRMPAGAADLARRALTPMRAGTAPAMLASMRR